MEIMENLCLSCKTNCRDRVAYLEEEAGVRVHACEFYTTEEHEFTVGKCEHCGGPRRVNEIIGNKAVEYDSCLGYLPGVVSACCGHGGPGHVLFENGVKLRFTNLTVEHRDSEAPGE